MAYIIYIYLCAFYAVELANLQNKKKSGTAYAEGIAVGVELTMWLG
jgi:hypothetical protein